LLGQAVRHQQQQQQQQQQQARPPATPATPTTAATPGEGKGRGHEAPPPARPAAHGGQQHQHAKCSSSSDGRHNHQSNWFRQALGRAFRPGPLTTEAVGAPSAPPGLFSAPVDAELKAARLQLLSLARPHMRAFYCSFAALFAAFLSTFAPAALLPLLRDALDLTRRDLGNAAAASVIGAVAARAAMGVLVDAAGPRRAAGVALLLTAPAVFCTALVTDAGGFVAARMVAGMSLSAFVVDQAWVSAMFSTRVVGTATAVSAGWGNAGGGVAPLLMPLLVAGIAASLPSSSSSAPSSSAAPFDPSLWYAPEGAAGGAGPDPVAWRWALLVPGALQTVAGCAALFLTDDSPQASLAPLAAAAAKRRAREEAKADKARRRRQKRQAGRGGGKAAAGGEDGGGGAVGDSGGKQKHNDKAAAAVAAAEAAADVERGRSGGGGGGQDGGWWVMAAAAARDAEAAAHAAGSHDGGGGGGGRSRGASARPRVGDAAPAGPRALSPASAEAAAALAALAAASPSPPPPSPEASLGPHRYQSYQGHDDLPAAVAAASAAAEAALSALLPGPVALPATPLQLLPPQHPPAPTLLPADAAHGAHGFGSATMTHHPWVHPVTANAAQLQQMQQQQMQQQQRGSAARRRTAMMARGLAVAARNPRTWLLAAAYGLAFGAEVTCYNVVPAYGFDHFGLSLASAGLLGAASGLGNVVTRAAGGWMSDAAARAFGMRGRLWLVWASLAATGTCSLLLGLAHDSLPLSVVALVAFAGAAQFACGAVFGVVPFVSRRSNGAVTGIVAAGGTAGGAVMQAALFGGAFSPQLSDQGFYAGFYWLGAAILAGSLVAALVRFPPWGGMLAGPKQHGGGGGGDGAAAAGGGGGGGGGAGGGEELYYLSEYTPAERAAGLHVDALRFAHEARSERAPQRAEAPPPPSSALGGGGAGAGTRPPS